MFHFSLRKSQMELRLRASFGTTFHKKNSPHNKLELQFRLLYKQEKTSFL